MQNDQGASPVLPEKLPELMEHLTDTQPSIPDALTRYLLRGSGADMRDERALRLVSLAAEKFLAGILYDVRLLGEQRLQGMPARAHRSAGLSKADAITLTTEKLATVLADSGVNIQQQMYYLDKSDAAKPAQP